MGSIKRAAKNFKWKGASDNRGSPEATLTRGAVTSCEGVAVQLWQQF